MYSKFRFFLTSLARARSSEGFSLYTTYLILGVTTSLNSYSLRKDLKSYHLALAIINNLLILPSLPWYCKCLFGSLSDAFSIFGYNRKPYMIIGNAFSFIICLCLTINNLSLGWLMFLLFLLQCFTVLSDVNYDALVLEGCRTKQSSKLLEYTAVCRHMGLMIGVGLGPVIWEQLGSSGIYVILSLWYLLGLGVSFVTIEKKKTHVTGVLPDPIQAIELDESGNDINNIPDKKTSCFNFIFVLSVLKSSLFHPVLSVVLIYYFTMILIPTPNSPLWYYLTDILHFTPSTMAVISILYELGGIMGYVIFSFGFDKIPIRVIYFCVLVANIVLGFVPMILTTEIFGNDCVSKYNNITSLITNETFCYQFEIWKLDPVIIVIFDSIIDGIVQTIHFYTLKSVIRILTKESVEASLQSTILSIDNCLSAMRTLLESYFITFFELDAGVYSTLSNYIIFCQIFYFIFFVSFIILPNQSLSSLQKQITQNQFPST